MKKWILTLLLLTGLTGISYAQPGPGMENDKREQKIEALYVAFMTRELNITEDEAQRFWPIHAQFDNEMKGLRRQMPELEREEAMLNIKKKYQERFIKVLGNNRTDEFYRKDREFRKQMIERLKKMRQQRMQNGGRMMRGNGPGGEPPPPND